MATMHEPILFDIADQLILFTIILSLSTFIPQLITLCRNKSARGVALTPWILWSIVSCAVLMFSFVHSYLDRCCVPLLCTALVSSVLSWCTLTLIFYYRRLDAEYDHDLALIEEAGFLYEFEDLSSLIEVERTPRLRLVKGGMHSPDDVRTWD